MTSLCDHWLLLVPVFCFAMGCSDSDGRKGERTTHESEGGLCLRSSNDERLAVTVVFPRCLSSSCDRVVATTCEVTASGNELTIASQAITESTGAEACTLDCGSLVARCTSAAAIPSGQYRVTYGRESADITLAQSPVELFAEEVPFRPCSVN